MSSAMEVNLSSRTRGLSLVCTRYSLPDSKTTALSSRRNRRTASKSWDAMVSGGGDGSADDWDGTPKSPAVDGGLDGSAGQTRRCSTGISPENTARDSRQAVRLPHRVFWHC